MFRKIRIAALLLLLSVVMLSGWLTHARATSWRSSLQVIVYAIAADQAPATRAYVETLSTDSYAPVDAWFDAQAQHYGVDTIRPVMIVYGGRIDALPPPVPAVPTMATVGLWSLRLRYWAWRHDPGARAAPQVRLYVLYHAPTLGPAVPDSLGLQKGMIGIVHAYASRLQRGQNGIVIAHELLHTLGATDKYDPLSNLPRYPDGYADPQREPRLPQAQGEIMAGRTPLTASTAEMPASLADMVIGAATAREVGLLKN